jgi:hypothetical protein
VRLAAPIAMPDSTRSDYYAVFLTVKTLEQEQREQASQEQANQEPTNKEPVNQEPVNKEPVHKEDENQHDRLHALRNKLLAALQPLREDLRPQLVEQPFLPHVTLALGLSESEAQALVRTVRAEPVAGEFKVDAVWLVTQTSDNGPRFDRQPIPLGRPAQVGVGGR